MPEDTVPVGVAAIDITPPPGLAMCGYAARTEPAAGMHDPLTVRALVVGDTAVVVADILGFDEQSCARIRQDSGFASDRIVIVATHTHGGPLCMRERGGGDADPDFLRRLEEGCIQAVRRAAASRQPARLYAGNGADPGIAFNRREPDGPIDASVPLVCAKTLDGKMLAVAFAFACHPVVLNAANRLYTADFPHYARLEVEAAFDGALALFLPGCSGDVSTGHSPQSSISMQTPPDRTYDEAERLGKKLAASVLAAPLRPLGAQVAARTQPLALRLARTETEDADSLAAQWEQMAQNATPAWAALYLHWVHWARTRARTEPTDWSGRVSVFNWGGLFLHFLPGEIFAQTALAMRQDATDCKHTPFVVSLADGVPGYIPPRSAYDLGGYEVDEAHRYYGMPAAFAPGGAEQLAEAANGLRRTLTGLEYFPQKMLRTFVGSKT